MRRCNVTPSAKSGHFHVIFEEGNQFTDGSRVIMHGFNDIVPLELLSSVIRKWVWQKEMTLKRLTNDLPF